MSREVRSAIGVGGNSEAVGSSNASDPAFGLSDAELEQYVYEFLLQQSSEDHSAGEEPDQFHAHLSLDDKRKIRYISRSGVPSFDEKEESFTDERDPMDDLLQVSVSILLKTLNVDSITQSALCQLTDITTLYMRKLLENLHKLTEIQRRRSASKGDIHLLLREGYFRLSDVVAEYTRSKDSNREYKVHIERVNGRAKTLAGMSVHPEDEEPSPDDPAYVFFHKGPQIVPPEKPKAYIPSWMPVLPPDHTYKSTPKYSERMTDPREMREKLVIEGRLGEKALHHIMDLSEYPESEEEEVSGDTEGSDDDGIIGGETEHIKAIEEPTFTPVAPSVDSSQPLTPAPKISPPQEDRRFDIVAFANKRMKQLDELRKEKERLIEERTTSDEAILGRHLGAYSDSAKFPENYSNFLSKYYMDKIAEVSRKLKLQQKRQLKRREVQEQKKRKIDADKRSRGEQDVIEVGLFGNGVPSGDEEDDFEMEFSDAEAIDNDLRESVEAEAEVVEADPVSSPAREVTSEVIAQVPTQSEETLHSPSRTVSPPASQPPRLPKISLSLKLKPPKPPIQQEEGDDVPTDGLDLDDLDDAV
ncbi:DEKNAAC102393 [Brettanomyces naardenensis]|uniref:Transcription initiation factor TFIID subunit 8 n=1 Tax=Brettanomyces naardenensis TaxID=13370 RepID=A0A448YKY6_BRENA|nr:DEKNAAC102393 [Brettanomyces naardenensis]